MEIAHSPIVELHKAIMMERIRVHELGQDLDEDLTKIIDQGFSVTAAFNEKHDKLFSSVGCTFTDYSNIEYEAYIEQGLEIYKTEMCFMTEAQLKSTWLTEAYLSLIRLSCFNRCPSGPTNYKVAARVNISPKIRSIFNTGIKPYLCDGWMQVRSSSGTTDDGQQQKIDQVIIDNQPVNVTDLPIDCIECGDKSLKMLDLFVEVNGSDVDLDTSKLFCQMIVSSQCFNQVLNINPYIFGLIIRGTELHLYAMKASAERTNNSVYNNKASNDHSKDTWYYDCYRLMTCTIDDWKSFVHVLTLLWKVRKARVQALERWIMKVGLRPAVKMIRYGFNSNKNTKSTNIITNDYNIEDIVSCLKQRGFNESEFISNDRRSIVVKAIYRGESCAVKLFTRYSDFENEKKIYDWLEDCDFKYKPILIDTIDVGVMSGLVLEYVELVQESKLNTSEEIVTFAYKLLRSVEALHSCQVVHGDIKLSNLAYDKTTDSIKLFDFEYSEIFLENEEKERRGYTEGYFPEDRYEPISYRDDLCNVGATLFRLVYRISPADVGYDQLLDFIAGSTIEVQPLLKQLVYALLDITQGYTASELLTHPVFGTFKGGSVPTS